MDSFYVFLPSNATHPGFQNTQANFFTLLAEEVNVSDDYEVALTEISFTKSWYALTTTQDVMLREFHLDLWRNIGTIKQSVTIDPESIVADVNEKVKAYVAKIPPIPFTTYPGLQYDKTRRLVTQVYGHTPMIGNLSKMDVISLRFSYELQNILGLRDEYFVGPVESAGYEDPVSLDAGRTVDLQAGVHSIFVYSDIVKHSRVGNDANQLLRMVPLPKADFGDQVNIEFKNPIYLPIESTHITTIEMQLRDDSGEFIKFNHGRTFVTLHFRKTYK
ncbi:hypothetical protein HDE_14406 [Halotydeus destructor]|nr:hypothetical protein HDE_14406 [Halotydeus destructor]